MADAGHVGALVAHARDLPAAERARWLAEVHAHAKPGFLVVETCHRVEVYGDVAALATIPLIDGVTPLQGEPVFRHLISLAVGLESAVVGEDQVLHQLRSAIATARAQGGISGELDRLADVALRAGRLARSWRTGPVRSLGDVAIDRIERGGSIRGRVVVIVGAGDMGRLAARAAMRRGARVVIASRRVDSATRLARDIGAEAGALSLSPAVESVAGVVIALRGGWTAPDSTVASLCSRSVPVVDLSAPSAIEPSARQRLGALLTSIDDLALGATETEPALRGRLTRLADTTTVEYVRWLEARSRRSTAAALVARATHERVAELDALWRRLPELDAGTKCEIERMTERLAERLLREPLVRLGRDADGRHERAASELFGL